MSLSTVHSFVGFIKFQYLSLLADLEAHGGIYVLHSHMNHSCDPTVSVRHLDRKGALARITMRARRAIRPGEELTVTYVDPSMPLQTRRQALIPYVFGTCMCTKCIREEGEAEGKGEDGNEAKYEGLEEELRHGLGLL